MPLVTEVTAALAIAVAATNPRKRWDKKPEASVREAISDGTGVADERGEFFIEIEPRVKNQVCQGLFKAEAITKGVAMISNSHFT